MLGPYEHDGLRYYRFEIFGAHPELKHGVFTRRGGVSFQPKGDLNMAFCEGDAPENVLENIGRAECALGLSGARFVRQTHSAEIFFTASGQPPHSAKPEDAPYGYDAIVAAEPGPTLLIKLADCQGVTLYDPKKRALALVHSGWRGSVQNILGRTVAAMGERLGVEPENILAGISPSLGPCCAEFKNYREELPKSFWDHKDERDHFDFWAVSRDQLTAAGLRAANIEAPGICTRCSKEFFSYRGGDKFGRQGVMAGVAE